MSDLETRRSWETITILRESLSSLWRDIGRHCNRLDHIEARLNRLEAEKVPATPDLVAVAREAYWKTAAAAMEARGRFLEDPTEPDWSDACNAFLIAREVLNKAMHKAEAERENSA